jgi:DNA-directed RNA polymerase specialized sigma24 family protein
MSWSTRVDGMFDEVPDPSNPEEALAAVVALRRLADRLEAASVEAALGQGWTYAHIAQALGVTKQAVHKKHAGRSPRPCD